MEEAEEAEEFQEQLERWSGYCVMCRMVMGLKEEEEAYHKLEQCLNRETEVSTMHRLIGYISGWEGRWNGESWRQADFARRFIGYVKKEKKLGGDQVDSSKISGE
ncbi:hypothetical protein B0J13DRAFT_526397 [Dactylonectria estremocensis]|uniref:Uncharacterized protein n=1 Tax=Dactylonectria estremocensis TaxID=1079267 RepID=A0A9P9END0_9HYPO|nr:hypothetical protein B0J13DRAFT_526397 [Dactylonectria estremocensis]